MSAATVQWLSKKNLVLLPLVASFYVVLKIKQRILKGINVCSLSSYFSRTLFQYQRGAYCNPPKFFMVLNNGSVCTMSVLYNTLTIVDL